MAKVRFIRDVTEDEMILAFVRAEVFSARFGAAHSLRHSFVSLLLAAGRRPGEVAEQAGHSLAVCQDTYGHVIAEYRGTQVTDPAEEVRKARVSSVCHRGSRPDAEAAQTG